MTQRNDISDPNPLTGRFNLPDAARHDCLDQSRTIGDLLWFKNRDGRFVLLESLLGYLTNTRRLPGLEAFRIDVDRCRIEMKVRKSPCEVWWSFGDGEQWKADQCCGILALHKANWTAGKRIPEADTIGKAINNRINRMLVLCLPPEDFVAPYEQTWEAVCEEEPWAGREAPFQPVIRCSGPDTPKEWNVLKASDEKGDGINEPATDAHSSMGVVRKSVLAPRVTERYVRLSYLGDVLPWLREKALPVAEAEDAGLARTVAQCIDHIARRPAALVDDGGAAAREAEIRQKIEIEIDFRSRLVAALDKAGYVVKEGGTKTDERAMVSLREKYENEPAQPSNPWAMFFVHSKGASAAFCISVWFSSDEPSPKNFKWRPLEVDGMSVAGPFNRKKGDGAPATPSLCYHVSIIDSRLRFEALPLPAMRDSLLDNHLSDELAVKVAVAFERIRAITAD